MKCMKSKLLICIAFLSLFFLSSCLDRYWEHFQSEHGKIKTSSIYTGVISHPEDTDTELFILPDIWVKKSIIDSIRSARKRIWLEIYTLTDKDITNALIDAYADWKDVKVILEPNVFSMPFINKNVYEMLKNAGVPVVYADGYRYTFTHAKFFLIDETYYISTGNFTHSFFTKNRDFIVSGKNKEYIAFLWALFLKDFKHLGIEDMLPLPENLILSPTNSREKIKEFLESAKESIIIYTQTLEDSEILGILRGKQEQWLDIRVCTASNESNMKKYEKSSLPWKFTNKFYLHGKVIMIDGKSIFIGSQNLTANSLDNNRELGIVFDKNSHIFSTVKLLYRYDCE